MNDITPLMVATSVPWLLVAAVVATSVFWLLVAAVAGLL
jgi:hypothetical protein